RDLDCCRSHALRPVVRFPQSRGEPVNRWERLVVPASVVLCCLALAWMLRAPADRAPMPADTGAGAGYIVPPVTLDSLLTAAESRADRRGAPSEREEVLDGQVAAGVG